MSELPFTVLERKRARNRLWARSNPDKMRTARRRWSVLKEPAIREIGRKILAASWGDSEPACRWDSLPWGHPLTNHSCFGPLEIDHILGGGHKDRAENGPITLAIARGNRSTTGLRFLCKLHQLWSLS